MSELNLKRKSESPVVAASAAKPESKALALLCAQAALDKKAHDALILNVGERGSFTEYFLIASGNNERQVQAMADEILKQVRANGQKPTMEGYDQGRWILIDLGDVVIHLFHESLRDFYRLEELWAGAPRLPIPTEYYTNNSASRAAIS